MSQQLRSLKQGSQEWLDWRKDKIGASDAVIIMGLGYITPLELYNQKKGLSEPSFVSKAMQRGTNLEEEARNWYCLTRHMEMSPIVTISPQYDFLHASLDGLDLFGQRALEVKCPGEKKLKELLKVPVSTEYYCQIQHQYLVNPNIEQIDLCIYQGEHNVFDDKGVVVHVPKDQAYINKMLPKLIEFNECLRTNTPPGTPKAEVVYEEMESEAWRELSALKELRERMKADKKLEDQMIEDIKFLTQGMNCRGLGMTVSYTEVKGSVDYGSIPQLKGVDLDQYRKEPSKRMTISFV